MATTEVVLQHRSATAMADEAAAQRFVDEHVSQFAWGALPAAQPAGVVAAVAAVPRVAQERSGGASDQSAGCPKGSGPALAHRYVVLRECSSLPKATLWLPTQHHKVLAGGVILHGRTVVTGSFPHPPRPRSDASEGGGGGNAVESWVVEHIPLTNAAKIEIVVVAVFDPEGWVETAIKATAWRTLSQKARDAAVYRHDMGGHGSVVAPTPQHHSQHHHEAVPVAVLNCPKANDDDDVDDGGIMRQHRHHNAWVLVGGGCASTFPIVACGPEWHRVWRVAAAPHDELMCYSISVRMSAAFLRASDERQRAPRHRGDGDGSEDDGAASDLDDASARWHTRRPSSTSDGDRSSSIDFASVRSPTLHRVDTREGVADFTTDTLRSLRSSYGGGIVLGSDLETATSSVVFDAVDPSANAASQPPACGSRGGVNTAADVHPQPALHRPDDRPPPQDAVDHHAIQSSHDAGPLHEGAVLASLGGRERRQQRLAGGGLVQSPTGRSSASPQPLVSSCFGPMGQWSVHLPEPFGAMSTLFRCCEHQDPIALHALQRGSIGVGRPSRRTTTPPKDSSNNRTTAHPRRTPRSTNGAYFNAKQTSPLPLSAISDNGTARAPPSGSNARGVVVAKARGPPTWKR